MKAHKHGKRIGLDALLLACGLCLMGTSVSLADEFRSFWVDAWGAGFRSQTEVDDLLGVPGSATEIGTIREANCNAVLVQVRRRADVCYPSGMSEPYMSGLSPSNFNALQAIIDAAHDTTGGKQRIEVHCWMVTFATDLGTVYSQHIDEPSGSLESLDNYWPTRSDSGAETDDGAFDPGHPDVLKYLSDVCMDLVNNFDIDGIHYDYIRFTANNQGYNPTSVARYNARYGLTGQPASSDAQFKQWRRDQVTALVRRVYALIQKSKPQVKQSAAAVTWNPSPTTSTRAAFMSTRPYYDVYSDWDAWMEEGILDFAAPMTYYNYASLPTDYVRWMNFEKDRKFNRHMVVGPGIYMNSLSNAILELQMTRNASSAGNYAEGFCGYSYRAPYSGGSWSAFSPSLVSQVTSSPANIPDMPWKSNPTKGHMMGTVTYANNNAWADGAIVSITGPESRSMYCDGTGFYAFIDVTPGTYTLTVSKSGYSDVTGMVTVAIGQVTGNMYETNFVLGGDLPPQISGVQSSSITASAATITWSTDVAATSQVEYGTTTTYGNLTTLNSTAVKQHTVTLSALVANTLYHYRVISTNSYGTTFSDDYTLTTNGPPQITDVQATNLTASSATITWTTSAPANSQVRYGLTSSYGSLSSLNSTNVTAHTVTLANLSPSTLYHYQVVSSNTYGSSQSADFTFNTAGLPIISNVQTTDLAADSVTVTWATDVPADTQVQYGLTDAYGQSSTLNSTQSTTHSAQLSGLSPDTLYHFRVRSANAAGVAYSADATFSTAGAPVISSVTAASMTATSATITWTTDVKADTQVEYGSSDDYGSSTTLDTAMTLSHSTLISGLTPSTLYHYRARSSNAAGVTFSADLTFTTAAAAPVEIVIDNLDTGWANTSPSGSSWTSGSVTVVPKVGTNYLYTRGTGDSTKSAATRACTWTPTLLQAGYYDVYVFYQIGSNRSTSAPYTVVHYGGEVTSIQNQYSSTPNQGDWFLIGENLPFLAGTTGYVELGNNTSDTGYVSADAAKFIFKSSLDTTPPTTPIVTDSGIYTASITQLTASWTSSDTESGIKKSEYRIVDQAGLVIRDWTQVVSDMTVDDTALTLVQGHTYFFEVRTTNNLDLVSEVGQSDGIIVFRLDADGNGFVNAADTDVFRTCLSGADIAYPLGLSVDCSRFDMDLDVDVDLDDFGVFQRCLTGYDPLEPNCLK